MKKQVKDTSVDSEIKYICGFDDYKFCDEPINLYHKLRKFFGLKFKAKDYDSNFAMYSIKDGVIEHINRKQ